MTTQTYSATIGGTVYNVTANLGVQPGQLGWFNVKSYGAVGDGVTDDTGAIQEAIDACAAGGGGVVIIPDGIYRITSGLNIAFEGTARQIELRAHGAEIILDASSADAVLEVGQADAATRNVIVSGGMWRIASRDWTNTIGIYLRSASKCVLRDVHVGNAEVGIKLSGEDGLGCAYNIVDFRNIYDCETAIQLTGDPDGWVNSNHFYNGSIQYTSAVDAVDCSGGWAIDLVTPTNGDHIYNDNHFYGLTLEIASTHTAGNPGAVRVFGEYNNFYSLRIERFTAPLYTGITGTIAAGSYSAQRNKIFTGYTGATGHDFASIVKVDTANERLAFDFYGGKETVLSGASATFPALRVQTLSSGFKALAVHQSAGTSPTFTVDSAGAVACTAVTSSGHIETTGTSSMISANDVYAADKLVFGNTIQILKYNGDPNGAATAPKGSLASDYANGKLYINTDGGTTWVVVGTQT